jgi:serine/threonine protein phosphatase PrpC
MYALDADQLAVRVREANWDLRAHVERDPALDGMATTFTGMFISRTGSLLLAHTGDSRAYRLHDGVFAQQTRDDSYVQALVDRGLVAASDAASHPHRNLITASLSGGEDDVAVVREHTAVPGDRWLLCSDGLTDYVPDAEFAALLRGHRDPHDAAAACVALAIEAGSRDNVTVVVCDVVADEMPLPVVLGGRNREPDFYGAAAVRFTEGLESA